MEIMQYVWEEGKCLKYGIIQGDSHPGEKCGFHLVQEIVNFFVK